MNKISNKLADSNRRGIEVTKQESPGFFGFTDCSSLEKQRQGIERGCVDCSVEGNNWEEKEAYGHGWCCCVS